MMKFNLQSPINEILDSIYIFINESEDLISPPLKVEKLQNGETWCILKCLRTNLQIVIWIENNNIYFDDDDIHWPLNDPSIDIDLIILAIFEDPCALLKASENAKSQRLLKQYSDNLKTRANELRMYIQ